MSPTLTREQLRCIDQLAVERFGMPSLLLMENAGRNAAEVIRQVYGPTGRVAVCCGTGNNGGDGCVIARHLHNTGWQVRLMMAGRRSRMTADTKINLNVVDAMRLDVRVAADRDMQEAFALSIRDDEVVVDALLGTGFQGEVRRPTADLIVTLNAAPKRAMVAVDVPSGLDCDSGSPSAATIRADLTITFVALKTGFAAPSAAAYLGRIVVVDIGAPRELLDEVAGRRVPS